MLTLAQAEIGGFSSLEYDLLQRAALIGSVYGVLVLLGLIINVVFVVRWMRRPPPMRHAVNRLLGWPWTGCDVRFLLIVLLSGFLAAAFARGAWLRLTDGWGMEAASRLVLLQSLVFHGLGLVAVAIMLWRRRRAWRDAFGMDLFAAPLDVVKGLVALLGVLPALLLATVLFHLFLQLVGHQPSLQEVAFAIADEKNRWMRAYFLALAVGLAPLFEEIIFRGLLLPVLARRYGVWAGLLVTSFLFAIIHGHLPSFVTLFGLSMALGAAYVYTGSLTVPVAMHAFFNAITTAILLSIS